MSKEDRAYCAGLYEGEGSISTQIQQYRILQNGEKGAASRQITLSIAMTDKEPLELFEDLTGYGTIFGPYSYGKNRKPAYTYRVTTFEKVQFVICNMWDWLSPRRKDQIEIAFTKYTSHKITYPNRSWKR